MTQVWSLGWEDSLEKEMATHSSTLAWRIPWTEEPGRFIVHGVVNNLTQLSDCPQWWRFKSLNENMFPLLFAAKILAEGLGGPRTGTYNIDCDSYSHCPHGFFYSTFFLASLPLSMQLPGFSKIRHPSNINLHKQKRKWQPTPVFLCGKCHGQRNLVVYSPWGCKSVGHDIRLSD